jgi:membrane-associated phospholipid phosphatase
MESWLMWGTRIIQAVQASGSPLLDSIFRAITLLGDERFALVLLPLVFWCVNKSLGIHLGFVCLASNYVNGALKWTFAVPRPSADAVRVLTEAEGYTFPSGHAQVTATTWGYLATQVRRAWFWVAAVVLVLLVALSRVYLGVHYPQDVVVGLLIGAAVVAAYNVVVRRWGARLAGLPVSSRLALSVLVPVALLAVHSGPEAALGMGVLLGLSVGLNLEGQLVRFRADGPIAKRALRFLLGFAVLFALYAGLKVVLPSGTPFRVLRYGLMGLWASLLAPWVFVRLGLAASDLA